MTDTTENLVLEHLEHLQASQDRIERTMGKIKHRLGRLESAVSDLRVDVVRISSTLAYHEALFGRIGKRLERIEHRLDVIDAEAAG